MIYSYTVSMPDAIAAQTRPRHADTHVIRLHPRWMFVRTADTGPLNIAWIVGTELHDLSSWDGDAELFWGRFSLPNHELRAVPLRALRQYLIEALPYDGKTHPAGTIWCFGFLERQPSVALREISERD